ncbi:hypothetical protein GMMP15_370041 [Candidatus Magnetomoraceae bacterium gMMP-15]
MQENTLINQFQETKTIIDDQKNSSAFKFAVVSAFIIILIVSIIANAVLWFQSYNYAKLNKNLNGLIKQKKSEAKQLQIELDVCNQQIKMLDDQSAVKIIMKKLQPHLDPILVEEYNRTIRKYSQKYGFPSGLIACLIMRESSFNQLAESSAGARGPMQIMPGFHKDKLEKLHITSNELFYIDYNINIGCWILREYINKNKGNIKKALTAYVGGKNNKYVNDILEYYAEVTIISEKNIIVESEPEKKSEKAELEKSEKTEIKKNH